ncbi:serine/threonine protein phosphatase [Macrococcus hajekii]|uniref:Serine/threonine protein phosphatase n=1 Tax=Macrococcus hajekii TaxID=198482 RepID=A0A4R6BJM0_9STAP|nr:metallophosphoesterase [Macrococcus hajekii]TDM01857.1 serine/threonine protein phosphatase [Macrococcus hajekii]GGB08040.1 serine/threonine protein phosphatase [Macrococcus hajekii]
MKLRDQLVQFNIRNKRTIVISDIHGELTLFKELLEEVAWTEQDILIINGDILDKGPDSLGTMRYIRQLSELENVYVIAGNCDRFFDELEEEWLYTYMNYRHTVAHEFLKQTGTMLDDYRTQKDFAQAVLNQYGDYQQWFRQRPVAIETEDYIFVHAGIEADYLETPKEVALTMPEFYEQTHSCAKTVVVGHYPAANFVEEGLYSHAVKINEERRIIAIDGGNQVKETGQLNALIIEADGTLNTASVDHHPTVMVIQDFEVSYQEPHTFTFPDYAIEVFEGDEYFTFAEHLSSKTQLMVKTEWIKTEEDYHRLKDDYTDYFMDVTVGEEVKLVGKYTGYALIKRNGVVGWVPEEVLDTSY